MPSVLKIRTEGLLYCLCGLCLVQMARTERIPSRGAKHGQSQWQYDHWKARDATKGARKKGKNSIVEGCQEDDTCRASQTVPGSCTEEQCRDLDYLAPIDITYVATWKERSRYKNSLAQKLNDTPHPGRMTKAYDFPQAARAHGALQRQQGRVNPYIPKNERERQRAFDEKLRSHFEWQS